MPEYDDQLRMLTGNFGLPSQQGAPQQKAQGGGPFGLGDIWQTLTPEERKAAMAQLMEMGGVTEQQDILAEQMRQAEALRRPSGRQGYGAVGGAFQGATDAANNIFGAMQQHDVAEEQKKNIAKLTAGRERFGGLLGGGVNETPPLLRRP